jgi:phosphate acyltransferase
MDRVKIAVDAMGSDLGAGENVQGAIDYFSDSVGPVEIVLVGDEKIISSELEQRGGMNLPISILHAGSVITMDEHPAKALRAKPDSSIIVAMAAHKKGLVDAVISAGSTGAAMAAALVVLKPIPGILRPSIAVLLPTLKDVVVLLDAGANLDSKPEHLLQFGIMGSKYCEYVLNREKPRVSLLNVGAEEAKGTETVQKAHKLLADSELNFIGNIEGMDLFTGDVDVIVCDGFVGNVILKIYESLKDFVTEVIQRAVAQSSLAKLGTSILKPAFSDILIQLDYSKQGGAPLLGVEGTVIICHGNSPAKAIKATIRNTYYRVKSDLNKHIATSIKDYVE